MKVKLECKKQQLQQLKQEKERSPETEQLPRQQQQSPLQPQPLLQPQQQKRRRKRQQINPESAVECRYADLGCRSILCNRASEASHACKTCKFIPSIADGKPRAPRRPRLMVIKQQVEPLSVEPTTLSSKAKSGGLEMQMDLGAEGASDSSPQTPTFAVATSLLQPAPGFCLKVPKIPTAADKPPRGPRAVQIPGEAATGEAATGEATARLSSRDGAAGNPMKRKAAVVNPIQIERRPVGRPPKAEVLLPSPTASAHRSPSVFDISQRAREADILSALQAMGFDSVRLKPSPPPCKGTVYYPAAPPSRSSLRDYSSGSEAVHTPATPFDISIATANNQAIAREAAEATSWASAAAAIDYMTGAARRSRKRAKN